MKKKLIFLTLSWLFLMFLGGFFSPSSATVECGWFCDSSGPSVGCKSGGDEHWIGWCNHYNRGDCHEWCSPGFSGTVWCGGRSFYLSCPTYTKLSSGCCNHSRPPAPPPPTPTPPPPLCLSLTAQPLSGNSPLSVTLTARARNRGQGIAAYEWDFNGQAGWDWTHKVNGQTTDQLQRTYYANQGTKTYVIKVHMKDRRGYWSNICTTSVQVHSSNPTPTPTPTSIPTPTSTPVPTSTPTPLPTATPTPTPVPHWQLIDGQAHSYNGFPQAEIINQETEPLITYQTPLSYTIPSQQPLIKGDIFEEGNYSDLLKTSFLADFTNLSQHLPINIKLKGRGHFTSQEIQQAIRVSHQKEGIILVEGNLTINQITPVMKSFLILTQGQTTISVDIKKPQVLFLISQDGLKISPDTSEIRGILISYQNITSQAKQLQVKGGIIAKGSITLLPSQGQYIIQPDAQLIVDLINSAFFKSKYFRLFYLHEEAPQL